MANYKLLIPILEKWEGGWSDDPNDKGGATMKGITLRTYIEYCKRKGIAAPTKADLKNISQANWNDVLKTMFWDKWKADEIENQSIANILVDWYWNSGVYGIKIPQRLMGLKEDGIVGPLTISAVNLLPENELFNDIKAERLKFIESIVRNNQSQAKYLDGWKNRINDFKFN